MLSSYFSNIGLIYLVVSGNNYPIYLKKNHPRLIVIPQSTIVPIEYQPTFNSETVKSYLHKIPNLPDIFLVFDDDMMVGRHAPPSVFITQFGGPNLFFEDNTVSFFPFALFFFDFLSYQFHCVHPANDFLCGKGTWVSGTTTASMACKCMHYNEHFS
jgi:hypothetical protein